MNTSLFNQPLPVSVLGLAPFIPEPHIIGKLR